MNSALLVALAFAQSVGVAQSGSATTRREEFRTAFAAVTMPLLVDLAGLEDRPQAIGQIVGTWDGLRVLAASLRRQVVEVGDAILLSQSRDPGLGTRDGARLMTEWLAGESRGLVEKLQKGPIDLREVNSHGRLALANFLSGNDTLLLQLASGECIQMAFAPCLLVRFPSEPSKRSSIRSAYLSPGVDSDSGYLGFREPLTETPIAPSPLIRVDDGDLDFGDGEVLPLQEVVDRAWRQWKTRYRLDARFLNQEVFVKGKFTAARFGEVMARHGHAIEYRTVSAEDDPMEEATRRKRALLRGLLDGLPEAMRKLYERGMHGPFTASVEELSRYDPTWPSELGRGTPPQTVVTIEQVTVRAFFLGNPKAVLSGSGHSMPRARRHF